ncbi:MAG: DnaJ domain-containing protein [Alphaproteobacteria bacterium]|nr:DnaJ domain-containing protein [Alphaproteobacteria bacterium]
MNDPYSILGVSRGASEADIKKAFRTLAKKHHPDATGKKDAASMKRFQEITAAYELLSDSQKRAQFDRGEIDANGQPRGFGGFEGAGPFQQREHGWGFGAAKEEDRSRFEDLFGDIFGGAFRKQQKARTTGAKGADISYTVTITFEEAALGGTKRVTMPDGKRLDVKIPAGVREGQQIRLKGLGEPGQGGEAGDALIEVAISPHAHFRREGRDIHLDVPISLGEAVLGGKVEVPTLTGPVAMTIPPNTSSGAIFRLKGKGVAAAGGEAAGDQYVKVLIVLPEGGDPNLTAFIKRASSPGFDPRAKFKKG